MTMEKITPPDSKLDRDERTISNPFVFISYGPEDAEAAKRLYNDLKVSGVNPWLDRNDLLPGQNWRLAIRKAIANSRYFIALFSSNSLRRGFVQRELRYALEVLDEFPESTIFVIPARLDDTEIPYEKLRHFEYVDLFPNWDDGVVRILKTMGTGSTTEDNSIERQKDDFNTSLNLLLTDLSAQRKSDNVTRLPVTLNNIGSLYLR